MHNEDFHASDGRPVALYSWQTDHPKLAIHIAHGMGEHAQRYQRLANELNAVGCTVYANDHRGHGATGADCLGYMGPDGWNRTLADAYEINQFIRARHPDLPLVLLGHSMGSMLSQQYMTKHGASVDGVVLSGSPGFKAASINPIPGWVLAFETKGTRPADGVTYLFGGVEKARFRRPVIPGDRLDMESKILADRSKMMKFEASAFVEGDLACSAILTVVEQSS